MAGHEQVHVAIAIVIPPSCARAETPSADSGLLSDIFKFAIAQIVVEHVAVVAGYKQVELAVVVIIGHGYSHTPAQPG